MISTFLQFLLCAAAIVVAGTYLSIYGDVIAEKVGLGRAWIGLILMASVTSLPELVNGVSAVTVADVPDIALGDVLGSCIFNIALIALMDLLAGPAPIFSRADQGHTLSAGFGIILISIVAVSILAGPVMPAFYGVGLYTPIIILIYFVAIRSAFLFQKRRIVEFVEEAVEASKYEKVPLGEAVWKYSVCALVIIAAATLLPFLAARIAEETGLGTSFVGTFFVGLTTSLPELIVSISALRIGAADMAIANLFGSNLFNIMVVAIDDIVYRKGPLLLDVSTSHTATAFMAVIMTGIAVVALVFRVQRKTFLRIGWDAVALGVAFGLSMLLLYSMR